MICWESKDTTRQIMKQKPFHGESFYLTGTPFIILHLSFTANKKMKLNIILISDIFLFAVAEGKIGNLKEVTTARQGQRKPVGER